MEDSDDGFITVVAKKNRKTSIPAILRPVDPETSFLCANPNAIAGDVNRATQEKIKSHRISKDDSITIIVASASAARALMSLTSLASVPVTTRIPESYSRNVGKITGVRVPYTDEQLLEFLRPEGGQKSGGRKASSRTKAAQPRAAPLTVCC